MEFGIVPLVGGDTDVGVGVGQLARLPACRHPERSPYRWAMESSAFISFKLERGGHHGHPVSGLLRAVDRTRAPGRRLRLEARPSFTQE